MERQILEIKQATNDLILAKARLEHYANTTPPDYGKMKKAFDRIEKSIRTLKRVETELTDMRDHGNSTEGIQNKSQ